MQENVSSEIENLEESGGEHRVAGRNSSGKFKKGVSGNPNGRPKKKDLEEKKREKSPLVGFNAKEGATVTESIELNAAEFMNACFRGAANGNQRLIEIAFSQMLRDKGQGQNPFAGLQDLDGITPEELSGLADKLESGDLDV